MTLKRRWFVFEPGLVQTRVGRRILLLFILSALLPVAVLGVSAYVSVADSLRQQGQERVRLTAKRMGSALFDRLVNLESSVAGVAGLVAEETGLGPDTIAHVFDDRFAAVVVTMPGTSMRRLRGRVESLPPLDGPQRRQLEGGGTIVVVTGDRTPAILMARAVHAHRPELGTVWVRVRSQVIAQSLLSEIAATLPGPACILLPDGRPVYCPGARDLLRAGVFTPALGPDGAGSFAWGRERRYQAAFWSLFLGSRYASPDWRVVYAEPEADILEPLARFRHTFPLAGILALLVVGLLSSVQIRRSLGPLSALQAGTERVARREFDRDVQVTGDDEFGDLARAFNTMSARLKEQFQEAEALHRELEAASEELRHREARLSAILETAADAVVTASEGGIIESFNRTAERVFGCERDAAVGGPVADLFATPLGSGPGGMPAAVADLGSPMLQVLARRWDGTTFPAEVAHSRAVAGGHAVFTIFIRDISERVRAAEERERLEAQLRHAQKMETIGTLAGGIAHDFNNILTPILGNIDLALRDVPDAHPLRPELEEVHQAALRARDLVRQILLFSRRSETHVGTMDLKPVAKEALKLVRASLPATIEIRSDIAATVPPVVGDPTQIHQVLMNLCTNAFHAMREHGGVLEVRLGLVPVSPRLVAIQPKLDADQAVCLTVRDTGDGMSAETVERLFEPFFTTKPPGEGTGLGMSIVHGIVTRHGGAITVASTPGEGTQFDVFLPVAEAARPAGAIAPRSSEPLRGEGHILVVDDDIVVARLVARILSRYGYQVREVTAAGRAVELLRDPTLRCDLLITDQTMPGMTGLELAVRVRDLRPGLPVMLMTGYSELQSREDLAQRGLREVLMKPLEIEVLTAAVARVLGQAGPVSARPGAHEAADAG